MHVQFGDETITVHALGSVKPGRLRIGDFIQVRGEYAKVITVQRECFTIESLTQFCEVLVELPDGTRTDRRADEYRNVLRPGVSVRK